MGAFLDAQTACKRELDRLGLDSVVWAWNANGWSAASPNSGRRWRCSAGNVAGDGDTGEEALRNLVDALSREP